MELSYDMLEMYDASGDSRNCRATRSWLVLTSLVFCFNLTNRPFRISNLNRIYRQIHCMQALWLPGKVETLTGKLQIPVRFSTFLRRPETCNGFDGKFDLDFPIKNGHIFLI